MHRITNQGDMILTIGNDGLDPSRTPQRVETMQTPCAMASDVRAGAVWGQLLGAVPWYSISHR